MTSSIFEDDEKGRCYLCGSYESAYNPIELHHVFGGPDRKVSDRLGLVVHLCRNCHDYVHGKDGASTMNYLHTKGQMLYEEKIGTREQFRKEFRGSYL